MSCGGGDEALEEAAEATFAEDDGGAVEEAAHAGGGGFAVVDSAVRDVSGSGVLFAGSDGVGRYRVVFMLSKGVTASNDSVIPAPNPAMTVLGPEMLPASSCRRVL